MDGSKHGVCWLVAREFTAWCVSDNANCACLLCRFILEISVSSISYLINQPLFDHSNTGLLKEHIVWFHSAFPVVCSHATFPLHPEFILMKISTAGQSHVSLVRPTEGVFSPKNLHCSISIRISRGGQNQEERQWGVQANRDVKGMKVWQSPPPSLGVWMGLPTRLYRGFPPSPAACALITHSTLQLNMQT